VKLLRFLRPRRTVLDLVAQSAAMPARADGLSGDKAVALHLHVDVGSYVLEGFIYDTDRLIIAFEHAQVKRGRDDLFRPGWGSHLFRKQKRSHICIKAKTTDWYQGDGLSDAFTDLRDTGFLGQFRQRLTYGGSMGAFGALVFADQLQATRVLAVSPQTTLNRFKAPWEWRFKEAHSQSWLGPNSDAKGKSGGAQKVICVYDRRMLNERRQVERLDQTNLEHINTPFMGHGVSHPLQQLGANALLLSYAYGETDDILPFYRAIRARRSWPRYYRALSSKKRVEVTPWMQAAISAAQAGHMRTDIK